MSRFDPYPPSAQNASSSPPLADDVNDAQDRGSSPEAAAGRLPEESGFADAAYSRPSAWRSPPRIAQVSGLAVLLLVLLSVVGYFVASHWVRSATRAALPQIDGTLAIGGLRAAVSVRRDAQGVPHLHAASVDDLVFAQGFVTAGDRLFQMDLLRRHAAGELAEVFGASVLGHDRLQRTLQLRAAADRAVAQLPGDQLHLLERYAQGVNALIAQQSGHLPIEFRLLRYQPAPWTPRDSLLVDLAMFEDLTNTFSSKLARETLTERLPPELIADLYPVGSWRDHPPSAPTPDLTIEGPPIEQVPLDESQSSMQLPSSPPRIDLPASRSFVPNALDSNSCSSCTPGSNNWVVSGAHTASGKPLLSNDMHLNLTVPGLWYEADLSAGQGTGQVAGEPFHVAGVSLPGLPLIVVGHNAHIAWGFTNLGADVQDLYVETTRGSGANEEFQAVDGSWQPVVHLAEKIKVKGGRDVTLEIAATRHADTLTPILNNALTTDVTRGRTLSIRWTLYDPAVLQLPTYEIDSAHDWPSFLAAFAKFGGPSQNVVYADDQGHIGFHAVGKIPLRGPAFAAVDIPADLAAPVASRPSTETPTIAAAPDPLNATAIVALPTPVAAQSSGPLSGVPMPVNRAREWSGYIPFDQLPQTYDPPGGVIATANARTTPDNYPYPITLNWAAPYRNERIWHVLAHRTGLTPADMLAIQTDVYSDFDRVLAERLAYALDHSHDLLSSRFSPEKTQRLRNAADLLRKFNGRMTTDSPAAAIVASVHAVLWPMLLSPQLDRLSPQLDQKSAAPLASKTKTSTSLRSPLARAEPNQLYNWGESDYALEQLLVHQPQRWLPANVGTWDDLLTAAVDQGLTQARAPSDLGTWRYGAIHTVEIEHPVFEQSALLRHLLGMPIGTGAQPLSGDATTVKQVGHSFGPSERFTADFGNLDHSTMNVVLGQSGNPASPWFLDQFPAWYRGATYVLPFSDAAVSSAASHTLTLEPR